MKRLLFFLAFPVLCPVGPGLAGEEKGAVDAKSADEKVPVVVATQISAHEKSLHAVVEGALPDKDGKGGKPYFQNRKSSLITLREVALMALAKNLPIARSKVLERYGSAVLKEAKAVFDPVFTLNLSNDRFEKFDRKEKAVVFKKATRAIDVNGDGVIDPVYEANVILLSQEAREQSGIHSIVYREPRPAGPREEHVTASKQLAEGPQVNWDGSLSINQTLPWGHSAQISYTTNRDDKHFLPGFRMISEDIRNYSRPWTSSVGVSVFAPAPFLKDFGPRALAETTVERAKLVEDRALWDTRAVINSTLNAIDSGFWGLVLRLEDLNTAIENRKLLEAFQKDIADRLAKSRATQYDQQQVQTDVALARAREEEAWKNYQQASNLLVDYLNMPQETVLLPAGYEALSAGEIEADEAKALAAALEKRPDLRAQKIERQRSEILSAYYDSQALPDLKLGAAYGFAQNGTTFGFPTWEASAKNLGMPDTITQVYGLEYKYPIGNRALEAQRRQGRESLAQSQLTVEEYVNLVEQDVANAIAGVLGFKEALRLAAEGLKAARDAFAAAKDFSEKGRLTQFELLAKTNDLRLAETNYHQAFVSLRIAESFLLYAQGILASRFAERSGPQSMLEEERMKALAAEGLQFFPPEKTGAAEKAESAQAGKKEQG